MGGGLSTVPGLSPSLRGWILPERAGGHPSEGVILSHVPYWDLAVPGKGVVPALSLLPVLSTEEPLDGEEQGKLTLGPLVVPSVWARPSPSPRHFPSCSRSRASPFLFRGLPSASCPQCPGCCPTRLPWASLPRQVGMGRIISSPRPGARCWYPG